MELKKNNIEGNAMLDELTALLIKDLKNKSIEYVDLLSYNRAKNEAIAHKYYDTYGDK